MNARVNSEYKESQYVINMRALVQQLQNKMKVEDKLKLYFKRLCRRWVPDNSDLAFGVLLEHLFRWPTPITTQKLARQVVRRAVYETETDAYTRHKTKTNIKNKENGMFNEMYCKDDDFIELLEVNPICINEEEYDKFVQTCLDSEDDDICLYAHYTWADLDLCAMARSMPNPNKRIKELRARADLGKEKIQNLYFF
jgi:hypothetical protein